MSTEVSPGAALTQEQHTINMNATLNATANMIMRSGLPAKLAQNQGTWRMEFNNRDGCFTFCGESVGKNIVRIGNPGGRVAQHMRLVPLNRAVDALYKHFNLSEMFNKNPLENVRLLAGFKKLIEMALDFFRKSPHFRQQGQLDDDVVVGETPFEILDDTSTVIGRVIVKQTKGRGTEFEIQVSDTKGKHSIVIEHFLQQEAISYPNGGPYSKRPDVVRVLQNGSLAYIHQMLKDITRKDIKPCARTSTSVGRCNSVTHGVIHSCGYFPKWIMDLLKKKIMQCMSDENMTLQKIAKELGYPSSSYSKQMYHSMQNFKIHYDRRGKLIKVTSNQQPPKQGVIFLLLTDMNAVPEKKQEVFELSDDDDEDGKYSFSFV